MFTNRMANRRADRVAQNLRDASQGVPIAVLAEAADTDPQTLSERLSGRDEPTVADLIGIGGFLRIDPNSFLKGVAQ